MVLIKDHTTGLSATKSLATSSLLRSTAKRILNEVVGSDAPEIGRRQNLFFACRHADGTSNMTPCFVRGPHMPRIAARNACLSFRNCSRFRYYGIQHADFVVHGSSGDRPRRCLQQFRPAVQQGVPLESRDSDSIPAEDSEGQLFVAADVQQPHIDRMPGHGLRTTGTNARRRTAGNRTISRCGWSNATLRRAVAALRKIDFHSEP